MEENYEQDSGKDLTVARIRALTKVFQDIMGCIAGLFFLHGMQISTGCIAYFARTGRRVFQCDYPIIVVVLHCRWVPVELGLLENLEELDLSFNKLKKLPKELAGLVSLKSLRVASNKLEELPPELTDLPRVTSIDVSHNRLASLSSLRLPSMASLRVLNAQVIL